MAPDTDREQRLDEVIADYLDAVAAGRAPDRQELLGRNPDLASELLTFFRDQDRLEGVMAPLRAAPQSTASWAGGTANQSAEPLGPGSRFGEYEIVDVIARSGMGIVYRATQFLGTTEPRPSRVVALKMIRAGRWASSADVQRFQLEAEAAASLEHANIVPIYDVGIHEGQPYLSMKLIDGGSLAEHVRDKRPPVAEAVRLVAVVARAVDFAHQRGILHRDLKPANVLLDGDNRPYLTDFGLAKWVDREQDLTPSGIAVGTPSYMAPEQAFPARAGVASAAAGLTTRADVYGLGAVLFELLTGRPPFRGDTPLDTLLEVLEKPAPQPRGLVPALDRDLEIICLKCLEKDPAQRYATAAELADDLERYLRGEPINARPSGMLERAWRRVKRQPVVFSLLLALGLSLIGGIAAVTWQWRRAEDNLAQKQVEWQRAETLLIEKEEQRLKAQKHANEANEARQKAEQEYQRFNTAVSDFCQRTTTSGVSDPSSLALKRSLLQAALPHFEGFVKRRGHDEVVENNLALTYLFLGEMDAKPDASLALYQKARTLLEGLVANHPNERRIGNLALAHYRIGVLLDEKGRRDEAAVNYERTCALIKPLCDVERPNVEDIGLLASAFNRLGYYHTDAKRDDRAEECFERHVALCKQVTRLGLDRPDDRRKIADGILNVAHSLARAGRRETAHQKYGEAIEAFRPLLTPTSPVGWHVNAHNALENFADTGPGRAALARELSASHRAAGHAYRSARRRAS